MLVPPPNPVLEHPACLIGPDSWDVIADMCFRPAKLLPSQDTKRDEQRGASGHKFDSKASSPTFGLQV